jgi:hypothetical protein
MSDDASSHMLARFVEHDSTEENLRLLAAYLEGNGRPLSFYTDKAALFTTAPKTKRGELAGKDRTELPPTQIGRALNELDIEWIGAHSPQAKGRVERGFGTAQDRLVKGLRVAKAKTLANAQQNLSKVARAKPARPSSRLLYARPPLQSSTSIRLACKAKPSADASHRIWNRGLAAAYAGANSIASALLLLNRRDPSRITHTLSLNSPTPLPNRAFKNFRR